MSRVIVTGVDGFGAGKDAVVLANALAAGDDAEVLLTGVWPETLLPVPLLTGPGFEPLEAVERMLLETRSAYAPRAITRPLSDLSPARALRRVAREEHARAIVLGSAVTAPEGGVRAGRDARQVIHDAPCAVALAPRGLHARQPFAIRRIVVGTDGGEEGTAALAQSAALARSLGAELTAVAVLDDNLPRTFGPMNASLELLEWTEVVEYQQRAVEGVVAQARAVDGVTAAEVRHGRVAAELVGIAQERKADLLVVGSRRWGALSRVLLGSVAEQLLEETPCALLLVPRSS